MTVLRDARSRRLETPSGIMTTLASPAQGRAPSTLWRVEAPAGSTGPPLDFDAEQVCTWIAGSATVELGEETYQAETGDTIVMPTRGHP
jgi:quercetin dioxygenase-like cupin family protein